MVDITTIIFIIIFLIGLAIAYNLGKKSGCFQRDTYWEGELPNYRKDAIMKSRAVLGGQFSEQLAPFLPDFKYLPTECRFVGKPIDLIVFKGMDEKNINEVVFVEVKSGNAKLSEHERRLKDVIDKKKVRWEEYRIPEELHNNKRDIGESIQNIVQNVKEDVEGFFCGKCGRPIKHRGNCMPCNVKAKRERNH
jgi:hypothetical protein